MKEKYKIAQKAWIDLMGLKVGRFVKVISMPEHNNFGWASGIADGMRNFPGDDIYKVERIDTVHGMKISKKSSSYYFPFFVLQVVSQPLPKPIPLNDSEDYEAVFKSDGSIGVGCQDISFETLERIYNTAKSLV